MMAKPKHPDGLGNKQKNPLTYLRHDDRHQRSSSSSSCPFPSSAVLSALAIIAASPTTASLPLPTNPPVFLCPAIERDLPPAPQNIAAIPPVPAHVAPGVFVPTPTSHTLARRIADKYMLGMDNRWRKAEEWSLYGSACCSPSTPSPNVNDVQAWPSSGTSSQPSSAPLELDASSLPAGWHPSSSSSSKTESTIILIISIVLAVFLCVFMIACVCWRRSKKKKRDIELKLKHKLKVDDESEIGDQEKEAQNKMRIWARATARWKAHIRLSARRRRKRQIAVARGPRPQSSVLSDRPGESVDSLPRRSRQPSPSPSAVQNTQPVATTTATDIPESPALTPDTESQPEPSLPPAYNPDVAQRSHSTIPDHANSLDLSPPLSRQSPFPDTETPPLSHATPGPCIPPATGHVSTAPPLSHAAPGPYIPPATGHVSTDDKSHLRSLEEQASAPPDPAATTPSGIPAVVVSVPTWDEMLNELDGFPELECYSPRTPVYIPPNFPPPPSKAAMASNYHEDTDDLTDDDGSFTPSAPPGDHLDVEPSAPSLEDEGGNEVMDMVVDQTNGHLSHTPPLLVPSVRPSCLTCRTPSSFSHGIPPSYRP